MSRIKLAIFAGIGTMLLFVVLVVAVGGARQGALKNMATPDILDNLAQAANGMRGKEAGPNVIIAGASVENGQHLTYHYRIPQLGPNGVDRALVDKLSLELQRQACNDRMIRRAVDGGAQVDYLYRGPNGRELLTITVDQAVCARQG